MSKILEQAEQYIFELFKEKLSGDYLYHDFDHTKRVVENAREIATNTDLPEAEIELLQLAAWFHDSGHAVDYKDHEQESVKIARSFLSENGINAENLDRIEGMISVTKMDAKPGSLLEEIMCDADLLSAGKKAFFQYGHNLRAEWERVCGKSYSDQDWEKMQLDFLVNTPFRTEYANDTYGARRKKNIEKQRQIINALPEPKKGGKNPGRGAETMYRATYRNHINLSSIADNKANMMISINTLIISIIVTIIGSGFTFVGSDLFKHLRFTIPMGFLLVCCLISAIYAILSARPKITKADVGIDSIRQRKSSILFFGNFSNMQLPDFLDGMSQLKENNDLLYDNMSIDLYYLGKVLTRKYQLLRYSYNIFMMGLIVSVLVFMVTFFLSYEKI